jgi:hypothetical protein
MKHIWLKSVGLAAIIAVGTVRPAFAAYIDPNTGGMVFQLLAVLFSVLSGLVLLFSSRIRMAFFRLMRALKGQKESQEKAEE